MAEPMELSRLFEGSRGSRDELIQKLGFRSENLSEVSYDHHMSRISSRGDSLVPCGTRLDPDLSHQTVIEGFENRLSHILAFREESRYHATTDRKPLYDRSCLGVHTKRPQICWV